MSVTQLAPSAIDLWSWQMLGRCRTRSASWFFHPDNDRGRISRRSREAAAKRICGECPVRAECAAHALATREPFGVWGGLTEADRVLLHRLGWRDMLDEESRRVNVSQLERRLRAAKAARR